MRLCLALPGIGLYDQGESYCGMIIQKGSEPHNYFTYLKNAVSDAQITGQFGHRTSFEVTLNDQEIYSKLKNGTFPNFKDVVSFVKKASKGDNP